MFGRSLTNVRFSTFLRIYGILILPDIRLIQKQDTEYPVLTWYLGDDPRRASSPLVRISVDLWHVSLHHK
jgi:hypothetical protein